MSRSIDKAMVKRAFENAAPRDLPFVIHELKLLIKKEEK
jgi:hypothetical protein